MDATAPVQQQNEIGELAHTFNRMAGQIRTKIKDLDNRNQALSFHE